MDKYTQAFNSMGESGVGWVDAIFRVCVYILVDLSEIIGISYEAINIWIFVIIQPLLILIFFILWRKEKKRNRNK
tara:strand:+ start:178 stop:402 length:225 start_codon:yes stop_codon:yes gene_type:complete